MCNDTADPRSTIGRKTNDYTTPLLIYHLMFFSQCGNKLLGLQGVCIDKGYSFIKLGFVKEIK